MEDRLDDAIHVLRNHAEAGFPLSTPSAVVADQQISPFHLSYAASSNLMSDAVLNGCTVTLFVSYFISHKFWVSK